MSSSDPVGANSVVGENPLLRVHVKGLAKDQVKHYAGGEFLAEEDALGDFFHNRGCAVTWVSLMVDKPSGKSRGWGFVDFEDRESFDKALSLDGTTSADEIRIDPKSSHGLLVSPGKQASAAHHERQLDLQRQRNTTDGFLRDVRHRVARINEVVEQISELQARQEELEKTKNIEEMIEEQMKWHREKQAQLQARMKELDDMEAKLHKERNAEKSKLSRLEDLYGTSVVEDDEDADAAADKQTDTLQKEKSQMATAKSADSPTLDVPAVAPAAVALYRSITESSDREEPVVERQIGASADGSPLAFTAPPPPATLQRLSSPSSAWAQNREEQKESALQRAISTGSDVPRILLDQKMKALQRESSGAEKPFSPPSRPVGNATTVNAGANEGAAGRWADLAEEDDDIASTAPTSRQERAVLIKGLPRLSVEQLEDGLRSSLGTLWSALGRSPPAIESLTVEKNDSWAAKAAGNYGIQATVRFEHVFDAMLLVEHCGQDDWSSCFCLGGQVLRAEWPPAPKQPSADYRKMTFRAPTDASSENSYATMGTRKSKSSMVEKNASFVSSRRTGAAAGAGGAAAAVANASGGGGRYKEFVPLQNRTVILSNVPKTMKRYNLMDEVVNLLQREYQKKGYEFNPSKQLHKGNEGLEAGIEVRPAPAHRKQDENGGTVKIRFRNYADAIWLVEQAKNLRLGGVTVRAAWANPRGPKGEGRS